MSKRVIIIIAFIVLSVIIIMIFHIGKNKPAITDGCTLPGATIIYPAVMYNDTTYYWEKMSGPACKMPEGELPRGYEYVSDIEYVDTGTLTKNYQFTATFNATGKLYYNKEDPNHVCICITTYWLANAYVIFLKKI